MQAAEDVEPPSGDLSAQFYFSYLLDMVYTFKGLF